MKTAVKWGLLVLVIAAAVAGGYWFGHRAGAGGADKDDEAAGGAKSAEKPVAMVTVVPIRQEELSENITAYGSIIAPAGDVQALSVPFDAKVTRVLVTAGQPVAAGQPLIEIGRSAATQLAFEEAKNATAAAQRDLQLVQQRYNQNLATNSDLLAAQNAEQIANARLKSLEEGGASEPQVLKAKAAAIVSKVDVQADQIVPTGSPLVELVARDRIAAQLGIEPGDVPFLKAGQTAELRSGDHSDAQPVVGKIQMIGQRVDSSSRLVNVMVALPADSQLLLDAYVSGQLTKVSATGLVVPRQAVLPEDEESVLFTVKDGRAVKHKVRVVVQNDQDVEVKGDDLHEGDLAVVEGNYELHEGVQVDAHPATTQSAATEPAQRSDKEGSK